MAKKTNKVHIIHGWTYTTELWDDVITMLEAADIEVVMHRVPGLTAPSSKVWTLDGYVHWLDGELAGERNVTLIGHSNGGRISLAYTLKFKRKVKQLILVDSAGVPREGAAISLKRRVFMGVAKAGKKVTSSPMARKVLYRAIGAKDYHNAPPNMRETMKNMLAADEDLQIEKIGVPATLIWGDRDTATPISDAHTMLNQLEKSELHVITGAAHSPHATHSDQVAEIIKQVVDA